MILLLILCKSELQNFWDSAISAVICVRKIKLIQISVRSWLAASKATEGTWEIKKMKENLETFQNIFVLISNNYHFCTDTRYSPCLPNNEKCEMALPSKHEINNFCYCSVKCDVVSRSQCTQTLFSEEAQLF